MMKRILAALALTLTLASPAAAQPSNNLPGIILPPMTLMGNPTANTAFVSAVPFSSLISTPLGAMVSNWGGLQFGLAQSGLSNPGGTMTGYVAGDRITLQCSGITFATSPIVGVTAVSSGTVTNATLTVPGLTSGIVNSGTASCSQASTSGVGTGYTVTATLGLYAAYIQPASLSTGGGNSNGSLYLNLGPADSWVGNGGVENTFIGIRAGTGLTGTSGFNTAIGVFACGPGGTGTTNFGNVCLGGDAGRNIQGSGGQNTVLGQGAGRNVAGGGFNTFVGQQAGGSGGTNNAGLLTGQANLAVGWNTAAALTSGFGNVCVGTSACSAIATGSGNIIIGGSSGTDNCANGDESSVFAVCPGAGRVLTITGGGTPSSSKATLAGSLVVSAAAATVSAGQVGYGGTTVAAGAGTCPTGTVGGATVQGCVVVNIAGTSRNVPFF